MTLQRLLSLAVLAASLHAQSPSSANNPTPAQNQLAAWLQVINRGDSAAILKFLEKNYPAAPNKGQNAVQLSETTGGFDVLNTLESTPASVTVLVKTHAADQFANLTLTTESDEPHRITSVRITPGKRPPELTPKRMSENAAVAAILAEASRLSVQDRFSGAVMVARDGRQVTSAAYGLADRDRNVPNRADTRFRIGSMNKMFTAVATLQLIEAGKMNLTDTVGRHIPDYPNKDVATKVTIQHLLTHTGGTGDFFGPEFDQNREKLQSLTDYITLFGQRGLKFEPGDHFDYSNYGFLLLGVIIQTVTGQSYYDYVQEHVYKPAGMTRSGSLPESDHVTDRSVGYTKFLPENSAPAKPQHSNNLHSNADTLPPRGTSAGGGYSTVEDLCRFAQALTGHKLLNPHYTQLLTTGKVNAGPQKYAFGFFDGKTDDDVRWFGHGGGAPGMNGDLRIFPESGYVVAVLSNLDPPAAQSLADFALDRLPLKLAGR